MNLYLSVCMYYMFVCVCLGYCHCTSFCLHSRQQQMLLSQEHLTGGDAPDVTKKGLLFDKLFSVASNKKHQTP